MFVIVEGPNGSGKTTLIKNLAAEGFSTLSSPNGTPLAQMLRSACRGVDPWQDIDKKTQFLLFSAARLDEYLRCVHNKENVVVADRWWTSTFVYQCVLQDIPVPFLEYTIHDEEKVDMVILLGGENDTLIDRVMAEREKNPSHGVCTWTQERETMERINSIYDEDLPRYLTSKKIIYAKVDTTNMSEKDVLEKAKSLIIWRQKVGIE